MVEYDGKVPMPMSQMPEPSSKVIMLLHLFFFVLCAIIYYVLPTIESGSMIFLIHDVQDMIILIACARVVFDKCYLWLVMTVRVVNTGRNLF